MTDPLQRLSSSSTGSLSAVAQPTLRRSKKKKGCKKRKCSKWRGGACRCGRE